MSNIIVSLNAELLQEVRDSWDTGEVWKGTAGLASFLAKVEELLDLN